MAEWPGGRCLVSYRPSPPFVPVERKPFFQRTKCIWRHTQGDKAVMESPQPDIVNGGPKLAQTPELPPPHLLLDLGVKAPVLPDVPDAGEPEETEPQPQSQPPSSADNAEATSVPEPSSEADQNSTGATEPPSAKENRPPSSAGTPEPAKAKEAPKKQKAAEEVVVERRRKRVPSAPRVSSGIPRLSGSAAEPTTSTTTTRRTGRTVSESRQRPKSELGGGRSGTSRSANFGYSRRPHSTVDGARGAELPTSPTGEPRRTPRSSTSSVSSLYSSSGGRRMEIRSKIGSLDNAKHQAGGGNVKIFDEKKKYDQVSSKCGSKDLINHKPAGGNVKIVDEKLEYRQKAQSKVGSLDKASHKPAGGDVKIDNQKLKWEAKSKIGSLDNAKHKAAGGDKKIDTRKLEFREKASSKVGSMDNAKHKPKGGDKKIYNEKLAWDAKSRVGSLENANRKPAGGNVKIFSEVLPWVEPPMSKAAQIQSYKEQYAAEPRVGSLENANHNPGGGSVEIFSEKLPWLKFNRPNLRSAERRRIDKKGSPEPSPAFDRDRQWRYDLRVKGQSAAELQGFETSKNRSKSEPEVNKNNNNKTKNKSNDATANGLDVTDGPEIATYENRRRRSDDGPAATANGGAAALLLSRHPHTTNEKHDRARGKSDRRVKSDPEKKKKKKKEEDHHLDHVDGAPMPTASTAQIGDNAPSYNSTRAAHSDEDLKRPSPRKSPPEESPPPPLSSPRKTATSEPKPEAVTETERRGAQVKDLPAGSNNKENKKESRRRENRGVKDLHLTEGYAERFKLLPRPEAEAPVRRSPLEPRVDPEWKKKAQLMIDYDRTTAEMTVKTNVRPSTRLPRVSGEFLLPDRPEGYMAEHQTKAQRLDRKRPEKKPARIGTDRLDSLLPSLDRLLDVRDPPSKVYSIYSRQEKQASPRSRAHRNSEPTPESYRGFEDSFEHYYDASTGGDNGLLEPAYKFDRLSADAVPLDTNRASAREVNDHLPPLPIDFVKSDAGSATTATSSVSLHEAADRRKRAGDFLKWRPGEVPFDKRSSAKPSYVSSLSPHQPSRQAAGRPRKKTEGFAEHFSQQRAWFDDYNARMRNRPPTEKVTAKSLQQATFELY